MSAADGVCCVQGCWIHSECQPKPLVWRPHPVQARAVCARLQAAPWVFKAAGGQTKGANPGRLGPGPSQVRFIVITIIIVLVFPPPKQFSSCPINQSLQPEG